MKNPTTFNIDGKSYTIQPYLTSHGMLLLTEIGILVGADLVALVMQLKELVGGEKGVTSASQLMDMDLDNEALHRILSSFFVKLEPATLDRLFKKILCGTLINEMGSTTADTVYDSYFSGQYAHLFKVVWKTLAAQYGDFWSALGVKASNAGAKPKQVVRSASQTGFVGKSGA